VGDACKGQERGELLGVADLFGMEGMTERLLLAGVNRDNFKDVARLAVDKGMKSLMQRCARVLQFKP